MAFNKRLIFKNTFVLYIRLFVTIILALYTSRVLLQTLGVTDFGVYNVVGGIAAMFASLKGSFASATQRFYNYEIGQTGSVDNLTKLFNLSLLIHIGIALALVLLLEVVGVYMINNTLSIPIDRLTAANMVLQITIVSTILSTIIIPFDAMIMAHERMNYYALLSIADAVLKLVLILSLKYVEGDKLVYYGYIMLFISLFNLVLSSVYCFRNFEECRIKRVSYQKETIKELATFGGWNFVGNVGFSLCQEVNNFFLNIFGGVAANAARGVVYQLKGAIMSFLSNTLVALRPQATQEFANKNYEGFFRTILYATKIVYYLALCMSIPLFFCAEQVLELWLGEIPQNAVLFLRITLVQMMIRSFHEPIDMIFKSVGKLKGYQLISLCAQGLMLPITFLILKSGCPIYWVFINMCISEFVELFLIVRLARKYGLEQGTYLKQAIVPIILTTCAAVTCALVMVKLLSLHFIFEIILLVVAVLLCVILCGINATEREMIKQLVLKRMRKDGQ